jgi:hypothetical protein
VLGLTSVEHHKDFVLFADNFAIHSGNDLIASAGRDPRPEGW